MNNNAVKYLFFSILGIVLGFFLSKQDENVKVISTIETKTDTVFITVRDTVTITRKEIQHKKIRDTILIEQIEPIIKAFTASKPFLYGNVAVNGEVLGEVLKMDIYTDFDLPTVTNTITKTNTVIKKPAGLFITAGIGATNQLTLTPSIGAVYIRDRYLLGLSTSGVQVGYKLK
jgi:hypothetical protein